MAFKHTQMTNLILGKTLYAATSRFANERVKFEIILLKLTPVIRIRLRASISIRQIVPWMSIFHHQLEKAVFCLKLLREEYFVSKPLYLVLKYLFGIIFHNTLDIVMRTGVEDSYLSLKSEIRRMWSAQCKQISRQGQFWILVEKSTHKWLLNLSLRAWIVCFTLIDFVRYRWEWEQKLHFWDFLP